LALCLEARDVGESILALREQGRDIGDAAPGFARLVHALRQRDIAAAERNLADVRTAIFSSRPAEAVPGGDKPLLEPNEIPYSTADGVSPKESVWPYVAVTAPVAGIAVFPVAFMLHTFSLDGPLLYLFSLAEIFGFVSVREFQKSRVTTRSVPQDVYLRRPPLWEFLMAPLILVVLCATLVVLWFHILSYTDFFVGLFALFIPIEFYILVQLIRGSPGIVPPLETVSESEKSSQLIFMVISRESPPFVQESVDSVHASCRAVDYSNYRVLVVTDVESHFEGAEMVVVPPDYRCNAAYKARALNYALRVLPNSPSAWTFHLDEDAQVRPQTVAAMLHFVATEGKTRYVAFGFQSAGLNRSLWGFFAEADRAWTMVWHRSQMQKIPLWANGGNMLIRSDIEQESTWNLGAHICEDTVFEYKVAAKYGPVFGWHGGTTMERAPSTIRGLVKQRRRWFHSGLLTMHLAPRQIRVLRMYCIITWVAAFVLVCTFFAGVASYFFGIPKWGVLPLWLDVLIAVMTVFWLARAQIGLYLITRHRDPRPSAGRRFVAHLGLLAATPIVSLFCVLGPVVSLVAPPKSFEITDK
jgi:hypothetical protein